eukprot:PhF_6_TR653/c0_g1_i2/m.947
MDPAIYRLKLLQSFLAGGIYSLDLQEQQSQQQAQESERRHEQDQDGKENDMSPDNPKDEENDEIREGEGEEKVEEDNPYDPNRIWNEHVYHPREARKFFNLETQDMQSLEGLGDGSAYLHAERQVRDARVLALKQEKLRLEALERERARLRLVALWGSLGYSQSHRCLIPPAALESIIPYLATAKDLLSLASISKSYRPFIMNTSVWYHMNFEDRGLKHVFTSRLTILKFCTTPLVSKWVRALDCSGVSLQDDDLFTLVRGLGEKLVFLNVSNSTKLTQRIWEYLSVFCVSLKTLILEGSTRVEHMSSTVTPELKSFLEGLQVLLCQNVRVDWTAWSSLWNSSQLRALAVTVPRRNAFAAPPRAELESLTLVLTEDDSVISPEQYDEWFRSLPVSLIYLDLNFKSGGKANAVLNLNTICDSLKMLESLSLRYVQSVQPLTCSCSSLQALRIEIEPSQEPIPLPTDERRVCTFPRPLQLTQLTLHNLKLSPEEILNLLSSERMTELELVNVGLTKEMIPTVHRLHTLSSLTLTHNDTLTVFRPQIPFRRLQHCNLQNNAIIQGPTVEWIQSCPILRELSVTGNPPNGYMTDETGQRDLATSDFDLVRKLIVDSCKYGALKEDVTTTKNARESYAQGEYDPKGQHSSFRYNVTRSSSNSRRSSVSGGSVTSEITPLDAFDLDFGTEVVGNSEQASVVESCALPPSTHFTRSGSMSRRGSRTGGGSNQDIKSATQAIYPSEQSVLVAFTILRVQTLLQYDIYHFAYVSSDHIRFGGHIEGNVCVPRTVDTVKRVVRYSEQPIVRYSCRTEEWGTTLKWMSFILLPEVIQRMRYGVEHRILVETNKGTKFNVHYWTIFLEAYSDPHYNLHTVRSFTVKTNTQERSKISPPFAVTLKSGKTEPPSNVTLTFQFLPRYILPQIVLPIELSMEGSGWRKEVPFTLCVPTPVNSANLPPEILWRFPHEVQCIA